MGDDQKAAILKLAECLYDAMEHFDPSDAPAWSELSIRERDFYFFCVSELVHNRGDLLAALGLSNNDAILRGATRGEKPDVS